MTYVVDSDRVKVSRAKPWLSMVDAREIWAMVPGASLTEVDQRITGRAYLFPILGSCVIRGSGCRGLSRVPRRWSHDPAVGAVRLAAS
jgi:hypothetical protein